VRGEPRVENANSGLSHGHGHRETGHAVAQKLGPFPSRGLQQDLPLGQSEPPILQPESLLDRWGLRLGSPRSSDKATSLSRREVFDVAKNWLVESLPTACTLFVVLWEQVSCAPAIAENATRSAINTYFMSVSLRMGSRYNATMRQAVSIYNQPASRLRPPGIHRTQSLPERG